MTMIKMKGVKSVSAKSPAKGGSGSAAGRIRKAAGKAGVPNPASTGVKYLLKGMPKKK